MSEEGKSRAGRKVLQGATVVSSGLLMLGMGAGAASAHTAPKVQAPTGGDKQQVADHGSHDGDHNALVDLSHNQIPIQVCNNQVPVNGGVLLNLDKSISITLLPSITEKI